MKNKPFLTLVLFLIPTVSSAAEWKYHIPKEKQQFFRPVFRADFLKEKLPAGITKTAKFRGVKQQYAQFQFGNKQTAPITIAFDEQQDGTLHLYVDRNRNKIVEDADRIREKGPRWHVPVELRVVDQNGKSQTHKRTVVMRRGYTKLTFLYATEGYLQGMVTIDSVNLRARLVDGDGNGLFADSEDRLWIDLNNDEQFDPFAEQYLFRHVLEIDSKKYRVETNALGGSLSFKKMSVSGNLTLFLPEKLSKQTADIEVTFTDAKGSPLKLKGLSDRHEVPTGKYQLSEVFLIANDAKTKKQWHYRLTSDKSQKQLEFELKKDATITVNPLGKFQLKISRATSNKQPGNKLVVQTAVTTSLGLRLSDCFYGPVRSDGDAPSAKLRLMTTDEKEIEVRMSKATRDGFEKAEFEMSGANESAAQIKAGFVSGPITDNLQDVLELNKQKKK